MSNDSSASMIDYPLKDPSIYEAWTTETIRYSDLDPNGHVNNGAITAYLEDGRVRFRGQYFEHLGEAVLAGFVLVRYVIEFHAQLHYPGEVKVGTACVRLGRSSYTLGQGVFNDAGCAATAEVVTVRVENGKSVELETEMRAALAKASPAKE